MDCDHYKHPSEVLSDWMARIYRLRLTTTSGGNLSVLDEEGVVWVTPRGGDKAEIRIADVAHAALHDDPSEPLLWKGGSPPTTEWPLHVRCYQLHGGTKSKVRAVLHAHSPTLVAFSLAKDPSQQV